MVLKWIAIFQNEKPVFFRNINTRYLFFYLSPTTAFTTKATDTDKHIIGLIVALTMVTLVTITVVVASIILYKCKYVKNIHVWS